MTGIMPVSPWEKVLESGLQSHKVRVHMRHPIPTSFLLCLLAGTPFLFAEASGEESTRPNILFIFSDDHAWQAVSAYNQTLVQTPHIDRLAKEGMRFDRCLIPNPLCGPSRATVLTGTHSHINGFWSNSRCTFDGSQITFPKILQKGGYETALIGKWHLGSEPTGFDHWDILPGQGEYYNPKMILMGEKRKIEGYVTDVITDLSLQWLQESGCLETVSSDVSSQGDSPKLAACP